MKASEFAKKYNVRIVLMVGIMEKMHISNDSDVSEDILLKGYEDFTGLKLDLSPNPFPMRKGEEDQIEVEPDEIFSIKKKKPKKTEIVEDEIMKEENE